MVVSKLWKNAKWTAETIKGAAVVLASPNVPIPPTKLHPQMMAAPNTVGEWVRMSSWRFMWQYVPVVRLFVFSLITVSAVMFFVFPSPPRQAIKDAEASAAHRKHEQDKYYCLRQKYYDKVYYAKYDPLKESRPEAYALVYGGGH